ncbi:hypothetical protein BX600DRAFT_550814, partial [Xylariales sp. PMI_506]
MPFFGSRKPEEEPIEEPSPPLEEPTHKRHGLFGSRRERDPSPVSTIRTNTTASTNHTNGGTRRSHSILHRSFGHGNDGIELDPSIVQARERVLSAENAERDADRALEAARARVREARDHVKRLELEAAEEAKRAKIKQYHAREVSKRGKQLG